MPSAQHDAPMSDRAQGVAGQQGERNHLLRTIPAAEYARIRPLLEPFEVRVMDIYAEPGDPIEHVHFPGRSVISLMRKTKEGALVENGTIGREGMAGLEVVQGVDWALSITAGEVNVGGCVIQVAPGDYKTIALLEAATCAAGSG